MILTYFFPTNPREIPLCRLCIQSILKTLLGFREIPLGCLVWITTETVCVCISQSVNDILCRLKIEV